MVMVCEPVAFRNTEGETVRELPIPGARNVALLFCAEASGDRNETPAARTSRKRKTRVGKLETPARVAELKQGGYCTGGPRLAACFSAHAGFGAGRLRHPGIHFRRRFRHRFDYVLRIIGMARQIIIISRARCQPAPPPENPWPAFSVLLEPGKNRPLRRRHARKIDRKSPPVRGTQTPSRRRA